MGKEKIAPTTKHIVKLLVAGDYDQIERLTQARRLTAVHLREDVAVYGRRLKMPPDTVFEHLDVIAVDGAYPQRWSVRCYLWTEEEGCSDLSLELTLIETDNALLTTEVDNLHVL